MKQTKQVFIKMLSWQILITCLASLIFFVIHGKSSAISAFLGGFSVVFAAGFASLIYVRNRNKHDAAAILVSLLLAEIVKLVFVFSILILVFKHYKNLTPFALIVGLMAAALVSGVAMSKITNKS